MKKSSEKYMFPLIESLRLKDGVLVNLNYHQDRLIRSMDELFPHVGKIDLSKEIQVPKECQTGTYKVRVTYGVTIERIEIEPYAFRSIKSLKVVCRETIDYHLKYSARPILQELYDSRGDCDDIIIVKNEYVTDSFAANLLFFDGERWFTPDTPLLQGTKRQLLLDQGLIFEKKIKVANIFDYQKVGLVNAMIDFEGMPEVPVKRIFYNDSKIA